MKTKKSYYQNPKGIWEKDGIKLPNVVRVKTDKCFLSPGVKRTLPAPNSLVICDLTSVKRDENNFSDELYSERSNFSGDMYTIEVTEIDQPDAKPVAVCLCMLDFCVSQIKKLKRLHHIPTKVFNKVEVAWHVEPHVPINIEEEILDMLGSDQVLPRGHFVSLGPARAFVHC